MPKKYSPQEIARALMGAISFTDHVGFGDSQELSEIIEDKSGILNKVHAALNDAGLSVSLTEALIFWAWHSAEYDAIWLVPASTDSIVRNFHGCMEQFNE